MFDVFAFSVSSIYNRQERKSSLALNYMHYLAKTYTPFPSYLKHLPKRTTLNEFKTTELGLNIAKYRLNSRRSSKFCQLNKRKEKKHHCTDYLVKMGHIIANLNEVLVRVLLTVRLWTNEYLTFILWAYVGYDRVNS